MKTQKETSVILLLCIIFFILCIENLYAGNYTWNGGTSTSWATSTNWTPNGVPSTNDSVTIVTGSNNVYLASSLTVKQITVTSGTLNLQSYSLTVSGTGNFNSGNVNNGTLIVYGTSTQTFKGTQFGAIVKVTGNSILLNGSTFNDSLIVVKKGTSNDNGKGNNTFNGYVSITDSASGNLVLSDSFPDTFNSSLVVSRRSTGNIYLAHRGTGNQFNGDVTFNGGNGYSNYYGSATYSGNIILNGNVYFGYGGGSCVLSTGKNISIGTSGISAGWLYFKNFTQQDSTSKVSLALTGTSQLYFEAGSTFNDSVTASAPLLYLNGTRFNGVANLTNNGGSSVTSSGGCYFKKKASIYNACSTSITYSLSSTYVDTFATDALIQNNVGTLILNKDLFLGSVTLKNTNTTTGSDRYYVSSTGQITFKGAVTIDNSTSGFVFGSTSGTLTLDTTASLSFASGFTGIITIRGVTQLGSSAQNFVFPSASSKLVLGPGNTFNGPFLYYGHYIQLNGSTFNSTANITRYGTGNDVCNGGNVFNGTTTLKDSSGHSNNWYFAYTNPDDFNGDITLIQKGTGVNILPSYSKNSTFSKNITIDAPNDTMLFGVSAGNSIFDGNQDQYISKTNTYGYEFKKLGINKSSGKLKLNTPVIVKDSLQLFKGALIADTVNLLTLNDNCVSSGGSDSSYVQGAIKKIGNDAFEFPLGDTLFVNPYHPLIITAPSASTDSYRANFISSQFPELGLDTSINDVLSFGFWELKKVSGSSDVIVTLGWNYNFNTRIPADLKVVCHDQIHNSGYWTDLGNDTTYGDSAVGKISAISSNSDAKQFAIALAGPTYCLPPDVNACNLIINGGFENKSTCPASRFTASYWNFYNCCFWQTPTIATPDYHNNCMIDPYNDFEPRTGDGFLGIHGTSIVREYVEGSISRTLTAGKTYYLEFYVKNGAFIPGQNQTDKIGVYLSDTRIDITSTSNTILYNTALFESPQGLILDNTTTWLRVNGCFVATGTEKYIVIGFFGDESRFTARDPSLPLSSYYFIDDVFLEEMKISTSFDSDGKYNCDQGKYLMANNCFADQIAVGTFEINWTPTTGLSSSSGVVVSAYPTVQTTYTATLSGPSACGTATATYTVPAAPLNIDLSNTTLTIDKTVSAYGFVKIGGYLKVDNNSTLTFEDCADVLMGPNAKIEIMPGCTLVVQNSHFYPCSNQMWSGIITSDESSYIDMDGSTIEGAEIAINGPTGASLSIYNSTFINNWESIDILHNSTTSSSIYIEGNQFSSDALLTPFLSRRSYRFISLTDIPGINIIQDNNFDNSDYGIYGERCNLYIYGNSFNNMNDIGIGYAYGIYLKQVHNSFIGDFNYPNEFHNVNYGVYSKFSQFYLNYNTASDADIFSYSLRPSGSSTIFRNEISATTGIISQYNSSANLSISENTINVPEDPGYPNFGICSRRAFSPGYTSISNNTINTEGYAGIYVNGNENLNIFHNTINLNHTSNSDFVFGIYGENETDCNVELNCISLTTTPMQLFTRGITMSYSSGTKLTCNNTDATEYGLQLLASVPQTFTKGNSMQNHSKAFAFGDDVCTLNFSYSSTLFPDQIVFTESGVDYVPGNKYDNNVVDGFDFYDMNGVNKTFYYKNGSIDFMNSVGDNGASNCMNMTFTSNTIVQIQNSSSSVYIYNQCPSCTTPNPSPATPINLFSLASSEQIADSMNGAIVYDASQYYMKKSLFNTLRKNQNWLDSSSALLSFYDNTISENPSQLTLINEKISELSDSTIISDSLVRDSLVNITLASLAMLDPSNIFEENEMKILQIYLNSICKDRDSLSEEEIATLSEIVIQCPSDIGVAVFESQNLLSTSNNFLDFNNMRSCESSSRKRKPIEKDSEQISSFNIFPNPCNQEFTLASNSEFGIHSRIEIYDFYGKKLRDISLEETSFKIKINVDGLNSGVYYLNLYNGNRKILAQKIAVLH